MSGPAIIVPLTPRADLDRWEQEIEDSGKLTTWGHRYLEAMAWLRIAEEALETAPEKERR